MNRINFIVTSSAALVAATLPLPVLAASDEFYPCPDPKRMCQLSRIKFPGMSQWMLDQWYARKAYISLDTENVISPMPAPTRFKVYHRYDSSKNDYHDWEFATDRKGTWRIVKWNYHEMWYESDGWLHNDMYNISAEEKALAAKYHGTPGPGTWECNGDNMCPMERVTKYE